MRIDAKPQIWLPSPILQVVPRRMPCPREVRDLILLQSGLAKPLTRPRIKLRHRLIAGHRRRLVTRAARNQLLAQPRLLIDLQHVHTRMRHSGFDHRIERPFPTRSRLPRQPRNQVQADLRDPRRTHSRNLRLASLRCMQPAHRSRLRIHKRLNPEADAIHSLRHRFVERRLRHLPRRALQRHLGPCRNRKLFTKRRKDPAQMNRLQQTRRPTAKVDRIDSSRQLCPQLRGPHPSSSDLRNQPIDVAIHPLQPKRPRGEVAERTLRLAERHRDIDTQ